MLIDTLVSRTRCSVQRCCAEPGPMWQRARRGMGPGFAAHHFVLRCVQGIMEWLLLWPLQPNPLYRRIIIQPRHRIRTSRQHSTLVDVALVGDLAAID